MRSMYNRDERARIHAVSHTYLCVDTRLVKLVGNGDSYTHFVLQVTTVTNRAAACVGEAS